MEPPEKVSLQKRKVSNENLRRGSVQVLQTKLLRILANKKLIKISLVAVEASLGLGLTSQEIATLLLRALLPVNDNQSFVIVVSHHW